VKALEDEDRIAFRYHAADGELADYANPNGSLKAIAGILDPSRRTLGLMPHPERAVESALNSEDGLVILRSMVEALVGAAKATA